MPGIFISYRRDDSSGYSGRIYDRLAQHFGEDAVFRDLDDIKPGDDFVRAIRDQEKSCDAVVAVVGREWLAITGPDGRQRLEDPADFVRLELASALKAGIAVIPALVGGARMPRSEDLPEDLSAFARANAITVVDELFDESIGRLITALETAIEKAERKNVWWRVRHALGRHSAGRPHIGVLLLIVAALTIGTRMFFESSKAAEGAPLGLAETIFVFFFWLIAGLSVQWLLGRFARKKGAA